MLLLLLLNNIKIKFVMHNKVNNKKISIESIKIFNKTFCGQRASNGFLFYF